METNADTLRHHEWTFADFLSTYRYWALYFSSLLVAIAAHGAITVLPLIARSNGITFQVLNFFYVGSSLGWVLGAFLAFIVASRNGRAALVCPLVICALVAISILALPAIWDSPIFLFLFGLAYGTVQAVFPLAIAINLAAGRAGKIDFGCALTLMSTTVLASFFAPAGASLLYQIDESGVSEVIALIASLLVAAILLLPARQLAFDEHPRTRHKPLTPRRRSPFFVAIVLSTPPVLMALMVLFHLYQESRFGADELSTGSALLVLAVLATVIAALIYLAYWVYRMHGELAGLEQSQRLLTPLAALLIAILVPLGLPVLIMTLGELVNDRARNSGKRSQTSIAWLGLWSFLFPPIAIAMIQNAANEAEGERQI